MDDDVASELVANEQDHVIRDEVIGGQAVHIAVGIGDARPHSEINDGRYQPIKNIHDEVGAVLPLLRPIHLPESFENIDHGLLVERPLDNIFDGRVGDRDIVDGEIRQHPRCDFGDIFSFDLDVKLFRIFLILNWLAILRQVFIV